jgi:hypothetical protein
MATIEEIRSTPGATREVNVHLCLGIEGSITPADFDDLMVMILTALEAKASAFAIGPAVAGNTDRREIDVDFAMEVSSNAEIHQKLGLVMTVLEHELGGRIIVETGSRTSSVADRDLVTA